MPTTGKILDANLSYKSTAAKLVVDGILKRQYQCIKMHVHKDYNANMRMDGMKRIIIQILIKLKYVPMLRLVKIFIVTITTRRKMIKFLFKKDSVFENSHERESSLFLPIFTINQRAELSLKVVQINRKLFGRTVYLTQKLTKKT